MCILTVTPVWHAVLLMIIIPLTLITAAITDGNDAFSSSPMVTSHGQVQELCFVQH